MKTQSTNNTDPRQLIQDPSLAQVILLSAGRSTDEFKNIFQHLRVPSFDELLASLGTSTGKKSFLVFKNNKYVTVPTENIAFFYIRYNSPMIMCFDNQEYFANHSLEHIQNLVPEKQFYRLNRQYLINFNAIKDVEHYFARKLLVNSIIPAREKLIVPREKVTGFLHWLDNR
jgi:two-component system, LytTR family, response regulator LytT